MCVTESPDQYWFICSLDNILVTLEYGGPTFIPASCAYGPGAY